MTSAQGGIVRSALAILALGLLAAFRPAFGQASSESPVDSGGTRPIDADAFAIDEATPPRAWIAPFGDLRLRGDFVTGLPAGREDLRRGRVTLRAGTRLSPLPVLDADASFRASLATDHNDDRRRNFDNETPDALELDRAAVRWTPRPHWTLAGGKLELPLRLTAMTWDDDRRPVGVTLAATESWDTNTLRLAAALARADRFAGDDGAVFAMQLEWRVRDAAPTGGVMSAAYLAFHGLDADARHQLQRQNRTFLAGDGSRLASRFGIVDLQVGGRLPIAGREAVFLANVIRNVRLNRRDEDGDGLRARFAWGNTRGLGAAELGYVYQRIERDAVPGSFNSDDWWFHSADRGHSAWVAVGLGASAFARVTGFDERRDDLSEHTRRLLVELTATLRPE